MEELTPWRYSIIALTVHSYPSKIYRNFDTWWYYGLQTMGKVGAYKIQEQKEKEVERKK